MFLASSVCLSVSLSAIDYSKSYETDYDESFWRGGVWPKEQNLDFGGDLDHDLDPRILKRGLNSLSVF